MLKNLRPKIFGYKKYKKLCQKKFGPKTEGPQKSGSQRNWVKIFLSKSGQDQLRYC